MLFAINKNDGEQHWAADIWKGHFSDPRKETWFCPEKYIKKKPEGLEEVCVVPVKKHERKLKDEKIWVLSYFRILNKERLGIEIVGESKAHRAAKTVINEYIDGAHLTFATSKNTYSCQDLKAFGVNTFKEHRVVYPVIDKEVRRADVLIKFDTIHPELRRGIAIEIQLVSIPDEEKESREIDWVARGYSVAWLFKKDFDFSGDDPILKTKEIEVYSFLIMQNKLVKVSIDRLSRVIDNANEYKVNFKRELESYAMDILEKIKGGKIRSCRTCKFGGKDKNQAGEETELYCCWRRYKAGESRFPDKYEPLHSCEFWEANTRHQKREE